LPNWNIGDKGLNHFVDISILSDETKNYGSDSTSLLSGHTHETYNNECGGDDQGNLDAGHLA
jgi:hypothetical protein